MGDVSVGKCLEGVSINVLAFCNFSLKGFCFFGILKFTSLKVMI